jgi:hypothetical protein
VTPDTWKVAGLVIAAFASVAAILGALYGIVTVPVLRTIKAEISGSESRTKSQISEMEGRLNVKMVEMEGRLNVKMVEMEKRLNERIDTRLVHRQA